MTVAGWLCCGLTLFSLGLYALMVGSFLFVTLRGRFGRSPASTLTPRVSVLKPLAGTDDELMTNLESFAALHYPEYEVLLGVATPDDPAYEIARRFVAAHPMLDAHHARADSGRAARGARVTVTTPAR